MSPSDWAESEPDGDHARETARKVAELISAQPSGAASIEHLNVEPVREAGWSDVPEPLRSELRAVGFQPMTVISVTSGVSEFETAPNFIGPDGYTKFQTTRLSWNLNTIMDDGHAIYMQPDAGPALLHNITFERATGTFEDAYRTHLETVQRYIDYHDSRPLMRPDAESIAAVWRLFYIYQMRGIRSPRLIAVLTALLVFAITLILFIFV